MRWPLLLLCTHTALALRLAPCVRRRSPPIALVERAKLSEGPELTLPHLQPPAPPMTLVDAVSIIAGTSIGGGFLALPSVTAPMGFGPAVLLMVLVWAFLVVTGIAYAEAAAASLGGGGSELTVNDASSGGVSVASIAERTFGGPFAYMCSIAFAAQMLAVVTAQVVKAGEIIGQLTGFPYRASCITATLALAGFTIRAHPRVVETANTALTVALMLGFVFLIGSTVGTASTAMGAALIKLRFANWSLLLPKSGTTWAAPIFINLLCFGQAIPLVVERMAPKRVKGGPLPDGTDNQPTMAERKAAMKSTRAAIIIGSFIPLLLSVTWIAVTSSVLTPGAAAAAATASVDPVLALIASGPAISIPVTVMATGAIGTTIIASYLTIGQFVADLLCLIFGYCSPETKRFAYVATVAMPIVVACGGPALYLPLLSFSGAFPTTFLYGLLPPLAAFMIRRGTAVEQASDGAMTGKSALRWLPGGSAPLLGLISLSTALLLTNSASIVTSLATTIYAVWRTARRL